MITVTLCESKRDTQRFFTGRFRLRIVVRVFKGGFSTSQISPANRASVLAWPQGELGDRASAAERTVPCFVLLSAREYFTLSTTVLGERISPAPLLVQEDHVEQNFPHST